MGSLGFTHLKIPLLEASTVEDVEDFSDGHLEKEASGSINSG